MMFNFLKNMFVSNTEVSTEQTMQYNIQEIEDELKRDFIENSKVYFVSWREQLQFIKYNQSILDEYGIEINNEDIYNTFLDLYRLSIGAKGVSSFWSILSKERKRILIESLKFNLKNSHQFGLSEEKLRKVLSLSKNYETYNSLLHQNCMFGSDYRKSLIGCLLARGDKCLIFVELMSVMLASIEALVSSMVLYRDKNNIINNQEFYSIVKNLSSEYNLIEATGHACQMYANFYSNTLTECYKEREFVALFFMLYNSIQIKLLVSDKKYHFIEEKLFDYERILESIIKQSSNRNYSSEVLEVAYLQHLSEIMSISKPSTIFNILLRMADLSNDVEEYFKNKELERDRQRFIDGDFTKERNIEKEALLLANVSTGLEFEEYLVNLFRKLGYQVEGTKASGDQGADLIIFKDGIKTVVQAKFYSGKVGNKAVQEVVSAIAFYKADNGMVVTNNYYTPSAIELAEANDIKLVDGDKLNALIGKVACNIEPSNNTSDSISDFLWKDFNIGECFYHNALSEEFELVELILSGDEFMTIKRSSGEEELIGVMNPRECNVVSQMAGHKDFSLVSIGEFYFGLHKEQIKAVNEFIKILNSIDSISNGGH